MYWGFEISPLNKDTKDGRIQNYNKKKLVSKVFPNCK